MKQCEVESFVTFEAAHRLYLSKEIKNGTKCKRVNQSELSNHIQNGWKRGRLCSC